VHSTAPFIWVKGAFEQQVWQFMKKNGDSVGKYFADGGIPIYGRDSL